MQNDDHGGLNTGDAGPSVPRGRSGRKPAKVTEGGDGRTFTSAIISKRGPLAP